MGHTHFPIHFLSHRFNGTCIWGEEARWIIFIVMIPALIVSYIVSVVFSNGQYQGLGALSEFNMFVFRIAFASFCAYVFGQLLDVLVFNRLRQLKNVVDCPSSSMTFGSLADTFMFFVSHL